MQPIAPCLSRDVVKERTNCEAIGSILGHGFFRLRTLIFLSAYVYFHVCATQVTLTDNEFWLGRPGYVKPLDNSCPFLAFFGEIAQRFPSSHSIVSCI